MKHKYFLFNIYIPLNLAFVLALHLAQELKKSEALKKILKFKFLTIYPYFLILVGQDQFENVIQIFRNLPLRPRG